MKMSLFYLYGVIYTPSVFTTLCMNFDLKTAVSVYKASFKPHLPGSVSFCMFLLCNLFSRFQVISPRRGPAGF